MLDEAQKAPRLFELVKAPYDAFEEDHRQLSLEIPYRLVCHFGEPHQIDARTYALPLWLLV